MTKTAQDRAGGPRLAGTTPTIAGLDSAKQARRDLSLEAAGWCWLALYVLLVAGAAIGLVY